VLATAAGYQNQAITFGGTGTLGFAVTGVTGGTAITQDNITQMFAAKRTTATAGATSYTNDKVENKAINGTTASFNLTAKDYKVTAGSDAVQADARRAAASKSYQLAIDQINQYLKNSSVSGINLLNGDVLKVTFDEKGNSSNLQIAGATTATQTFGASGLGLTNAAGGSDDIANAFATNDDGNNKGLNAAIDKLTNALSILNLGDAQVSQFQATVQNRVDFNKSIVSLLRESANNLTAADLTEVSAQYAAAQVQQSLAQTMLANTKQADQSILQLLR